MDTIHQVVFVQQVCCSLDGDGHKFHTNPLLSRQRNQFVALTKQVVPSFCCDARDEGREEILFFMLVFFCRMVLKESQTQHISLAVLLMHKKSRVVELRVSSLLYSTYPNTAANLFV